MTDDLDQTRELEELRRKLTEAEEALRAIREGEVDAIVVDGSQGARVFSLSGAETVYRLTVETMAEGALNVTPEGRILFCNERFAQFVRTPLHRLLGRDVYEYVPPEDVEPFRALLEGCRQRPVHKRVVFRAPDGTLTATRLNGHALPQPEGVSLCLVAADLTELEDSAQQIDALREQRRLLEESQEALRASEERFRVAQELSPDGFTILRPVRDAQGRLADFTWVYQNAAIALMSGTDPKAVVGRRLLELFPGHRGSPFLKAYQHVAETGEHCVFEAEYEGDSLPEATWFRIAVVPLGGDIAILAQDITARKQAEEALKASLAEKEVLLKEIHHRVKNNMQVLSSLVSLQANSMTDPAVLAALTDVRDRVRSMGLVHEKLYQSASLAAVDFAAYTESLLHALWRANRPSAAIELKLALQPVSLTVEKAVPCGLILNELASNTFKHAFPGRDRGCVIVSTCTRENGRVSLRVSDNGVGLPEGFDWRQARSLGLKLVQMLARQLDGTVEARRSEAGGTEFEIQFAGCCG